MRSPPSCSATAPPRSSPRGRSCSRASWRRAAASGRRAEMSKLTEGPTWKSLREHHARIRDVHLRQLFADDARHGERLTVEGVGLSLDYSKHRVTDETLRLLLRVAEEARLRERIDAMFRGEKINVTENRAVLHVALRAPRDQSILVD